MSDLVTALRAMNLGPCSEAADEIERLSAANKNASQIISDMATQAQEMQAEVEELRPDAEKYRELRKRVDTTMSAALRGKEAT